MVNFDFYQKCSYWDSADGWASGCLLDQAQGPYENRGQCVRKMGKGATLDTRPGNAGQK